jgi:hypothetical protein
MSDSDSDESTYFSRVTHGGIENYEEVPVNSFRSTSNELYKTIITAPTKNPFSNSGQKFF